MYQDHFVIDCAKCDHTANKYSFFKVSLSVWISEEQGRGAGGAKGRRQLEAPILVPSQQQVAKPSPCWRQPPLAALRQH